MTLEEIAEARKLVVVQMTPFDAKPLKDAISRALDALEEARRGETEWRETMGAHSKTMRQELESKLSEAIERHAELAERHIALQVEFAALHAAWTKAEERLRVALIGVINALDYEPIDNGCFALNKSSALYEARLAIAPPRPPRYAKDICEVCRKDFAHDENDGLVTCRECAAPKPDEVGT